MRTFLLIALSACTATGGFSLHGGATSGGGGGGSTSGGGGGGATTTGGGGGGGGRGHAVISDETRAAIAARGHAFDLNKDCFGDNARVDFHRTPVLYWPCFDYAEGRDTAEYSTFAKDCDEINDGFGGAASIACQIEHRGFDAHFAAQAAIRRNADRDPSDPGNACDMILGELAGRHALVANTLGMLAKPAVRGEFLAKVKSVTCAYDDDKGGTVELIGSELRLYTSQRAGEGWVLPAIRRTRAFPALDAFIEEYGTCKGGFSC